MIPPFFHVTRLDETVSTNEDAKRAAEAGAAEGLVIHALSQSAGKGRRGRTWASPRGNLYVSLLLRPVCTPQEAGLYSFMTALAVADTVAEFLPSAQIEMKWPNDVLVGGKKISGVLLEASPMQDGQVDWLVVGAGINVGHYPNQTPYPATSIVAEGGKNATVDAVLEAYLCAFRCWHEIFLNDGFVPLRNAWLDRARKGAMIARLQKEELRGMFCDLDEQGCLMLKLEDGTVRTIVSADVYFDV